MVPPPKWIFPSGRVDKIRFRNGFCLRVVVFFRAEATLSRCRLLTLTPYKTVSPPAQLELKLIKEQ